MTRLAVEFVAPENASTPGWIELSVGPRVILWDEIADPVLLPGESALLARAALEAVVGLELFAAGECPLCPAPMRALAA